MNTWTHIIFNWFFGKLFSKKIKINLKSFVLGGLIPDLSLWVLGIYTGLPLLLQGYTGEDIFSIIFTGKNSLYVYDHLWIFAYNIFQSPTSLIIITLVTLFAFRRSTYIQNIRWLIAGMWVHVVTDLLTHHDYGAFLFYPFDLQTRFMSPLSYWDAAHFGKQFMSVEIVFLVFAVSYLLYWFVKDRR